MSIIQEGSVKLAVASAAGKEAVVTILGPGDFLGEACLAGQPLRTTTATAMTEGSALIIEKAEMLRLLHTGTSSPTGSSSTWLPETCGPKRM